MSGTSYSSPVDFRIPQTPSDELPSAVKGTFNELYGAVQQIIQTFTQYCGIGQQPGQFWDQLASQDITSTVLSGNLRRLYITAFEDLPYGAVVCIFDDTGTLKARLANATDNTKPVDGFCSTVGGILAATVGEIQLSTGVIPVSGLTLGARYFLSTTDGLITDTAPVAAGNIEQYLGVALTTGALYLNAGYWIQH